MEARKQWRYVLNMLDKPFEKQQTKQMISLLAQVGAKDYREGVGLSLFFFWIVFAAGVSLFFWLNRNAKLKRRIWPVLSVLSGIIFGVICYCLTAGDGAILFIVVPAVVIISYLNTRLTCFCNSCGRTLWARPELRRPLTPPESCRYCGAKLL